MDQPSIKEVDPSYYDLSHITRSVQHLRFTCDLPAMFCTATPPSEIIASGSSASKATTGSDRYMKNPSPVSKWIVADVKFSDLFSTDALKAAPKFNNDSQLCPRWASKGHCFTTCKNKDSYCP